MDSTAQAARRLLHCRISKLHLAQGGQASNHDKLYLKLIIG